MTVGPGLIGALLVGRLRSRRRSPGRAACRSRPSTTCTVTSPRSTSQPLDLEPPFTCLLASGGHTLLLDVGDRSWGGVARARARRSTTRPARRSTRARGCSGFPIPAARRSTGSPRSGDPEAYRFPVARVPGLDFSFSGLKTALLYAVRDLDARRARAPPRRPRRELPAGDRPRARRARRGGRRRAARDRRRGRRELGAARGAARGRRGAARALHRQRGDDRLGGPLRRGARARRLPCARCVCERGLSCASPPLAAIAVGLRLHRPRRLAPAGRAAGRTPPARGGLVGDVAPAGLARRPR